MYENNIPWWKYWNNEIPKDIPMDLWHVWLYHTHEFRNGRSITVRPESEWTLGDYKARHMYYNRLRAAGVLDDKDLDVNSLSDEQKLYIEKVRRGDEFIYADFMRAFNRH